MIGYKDKRFCTKSTCNKWTTCNRALTEEVQAAAERWWGSTTPPIIVFPETPSCYEPKNNATKETHTKRV